MELNFQKVARFALTIVLERLGKLQLIHPKILCRVENLGALLSKSKARFDYNSALDLYSASEGPHKVFFSSKRRGFWLYRNGVLKRGAFLFSSYCMDDVNLLEGDVVVDCGANSGDLTIELAKRDPTLRYIGIEPAPEDFLLLQMNTMLTDSILINKALGQRNEVLPLYISHEHGDSSIIKPSNFSEITDVEVVRLDALLRDIGIQKVKFLKIEAEGYEPEVLKGAEGALKMVEFIGVDGGYERGEKHEQTLVEVTNFLLRNEFELHNIYYPWHRALFVNVGPQFAR